MDFAGLVPQFGSALFTLVAFVIALSVIVAIHEFGHYIVGRWTGIKADVFSLGFGPVLFSRTDKHGTQWQLAALPFGGYVKFRGDANAASATDYEALDGLDEAAKRETMQGAPLWARTLTVAAGPMFNFILSALIFISILMVQGRASDPLTIAELTPVPGIQELAPGDRLLSIAGQKTPKLEDFSAFVEGLPQEASLEYTVLRDGKEVTVQGPHPMPPLALMISPDSAAIDADMQAGDVITAINGAPIGTFEQLRSAVTGSDGAPLAITVWRDGEELALTLTPRRRDLPAEGGGFETRWLIGISAGYFFTPDTETPGLWYAAKFGARQTYSVIENSLSGLYHMIVGKISTCNLRGPLGIAETAGAMAGQGANSFISFIALLSTAVGLLNLFPIPMLDGGHLVFYAYEAVMRRPPNEKVYNILMYMGMALVLTLMVFGLTNDLFCK
ncbi:MAG: RIP metalloprotease RseP [Paracoccaceae bacterium]